jgi:magnesium chelatase family protein
VCGPGIVQKYLNRVSGPLLDRIDLHIEVTPVKFDELTNARNSEKSSIIRERVIRARNIQKERFGQLPGIYCNAQMNSQRLRKWCRINEGGNKLLKTAMERLSLSARAYDRILKVARTIADLETSENVELVHLSEAIQLRSLDRENWAG